MARIPLPLTPHACAPDVASFWLRGKSAADRALWDHAAERYGRLTGIARLAGKPQANYEISHLARGDM
jgi:hypothetical protein